MVVRSPPGQLVLKITNDVILSIQNNGICYIVFLNPLKYLKNQIHFKMYLLLHI